MIRLLRADSSHADFILLVQRLDAELAERDGEEHSFYSPYNTITEIRHAVLFYANDLPVACGALKLFTPDVVEVKRMYTLPGSRGQGFAGRVLHALEEWAAELSCTKCILETGKRQPEAIALYKKNGYQIIPNYGQYAGIENSVCFEKRIEKEKKVKRQT